MGTFTGDKDKMKLSEEWEAKFQQLLSLMIDLDFMAYEEAEINTPLNECSDLLIEWHDEIKE